MGRASFCKYTNRLSFVLLLTLTVLISQHTVAQQLPPQPEPCTPEGQSAPAGFTCPPGIPLSPGNFQATPLIDGIGQPYPSLNAVHLERVALYGQYGNSENNPIYPEAQRHYQQGVTLANQIHPIAADGKPAVAVVLFIGFSNCDIEICGGKTDAWDPQLISGGFSRLPGQACATDDCPNPQNGNVTNSWNDAGDGVTQQSLLYLTYVNGSGSTINSNVYLFNGAKGHEPLSDWDPVSPKNRCAPSLGPECNYNHVADKLTANHFSEKQVEVIFLDDSTNFPNCDLSGSHCAAGVTTPDAYLSEQYIGDIMRYLKRGLPLHNPPIPPRYPNLKQVFLISRNYAGYAINDPHDSTSMQGCLSPEPFSYEEAFGIQRVIVAQIRQSYNLTSNDSYSGAVKFTGDPSHDDSVWFDWGPYLWASGATPRSDNLFWCDDNGGACAGVHDFRYGDPNPTEQHRPLNGDHTHPTAQGTQKTASKILEWLTDQNNAWIWPWIHP